MAYELQAILGEKKPLQKLSNQYHHVTLIPLPQTLYLIPLIDDLYHELNQHESQTPNITPFFNLNKRIASLLNNLSASTLVAYVEAEYFGGTGEQNAILWSDQEVVYEEHGVNHAINKTLKKLGIIRNPDEDEFDTVGLGRKRYTIDWTRVSS